LIEFKIWKDFDELLDICHFIATTRQNYNLDNVPPTLRNRVEIFPITGVDISATEVRQYVRKGYSIRYLVPEAVMQYIAQHKLYK
jgi:nicotinate-nucleotide adenylyltransferase